MWTCQSLQELVASRQSGYRLIHVVNREPCVHRYSGDEIHCMEPGSGLATALLPIMPSAGGAWDLNGSGDADGFTVDECDRIRVLPDDPTYTLRRIWLATEQEDGYYEGLANEGHWPLCHITISRPTFNP